MKTMTVAMATVVLCLGGWSGQCFADEMGKMGTDMKGEVKSEKKTHTDSMQSEKHSQENAMKGQADAMKGEAKSGHDQMKDSMKASHDGMKSEMKGAMGK